MIYVIDTHPLVWFLEANKCLGKRAKSILLKADTEMVIPAIVLAESKFLFAKKRVSIDLDTIKARSTWSLTNCGSYLRRTRSA